MSRLVSLALLAGMHPCSHLGLGPHTCFQCGDLTVSAKFQSNDWDCSFRLNAPATPRSMRTSSAAELTRYTSSRPERASTQGADTAPPCTSMNVHIPAARTTGHGAQTCTLLEHVRHVEADIQCRTSLRASSLLLERGLEGYHRGHSEHADVPERHCALHPPRQVRHALSRIQPPLRSAMHPVENDALSQPDT